MSEFGKMSGKVTIILVIIIVLFLTILIISQRKVTISHPKDIYSENRQSFHYSNPIIEYVPEIIKKKKNYDIYEGLGDTSTTSNGNNRSAENNKYLTSDTVPQMVLKWKFDIASTIPGAGNDVTSRIVGPLSTPQADENTVYFQTGSNFSIATPNAVKNSYIIALNRKDGTLKWKVDYFSISTQAQFMVAAKYPSEYNIPLGWTRDETFSSAFAPIALHGNFIITGNSDDTPELKTTAYYNSVPQANGGPVLKQNWGVTNSNRHILRTSIFVLDKHTGKLVDADRYGDSGEAKAQGYCNVNCALRMTSPYYDCKLKKDFVVAGCSITLKGRTWTDRDTNATQRNIAILNGNRMVDTTRVTLFELSSGGKLKEKWRWYGTPKKLFAGDQNPYTGAIFATDAQAEDYNYHLDGIWSQRPLIDLERRQIAFSGSNGVSMPKEDIKAALTAPGTIDPVTGAQGYPSRNAYDWFNLYTAASDPMTGSREQIQAVARSFYQSQRDRANAIMSLPGTRAAEYFAGAIGVVDMDTGATKWKYWKNPLDTSQVGATGGWLSNFATLSDIMKWQLAGDSGDLDMAIGPVHVLNKEKNLDIYVAIGKDGSMQGLNPDTGAVIWNTKFGMPANIGSANYGTATDGVSLYQSVLNSHRQDAINSAINNVRIQETSPGVWMPYIPLSPPSPNFASVQMNWYSDQFVDRYNSLGGGTGKFYHDLGVRIPYGQNFMVKIDAATGCVLMEVPTTPPPPYPFDLTQTSIPNTPTTCVNDVVFSANSIGGKLVGYNSSNFHVIFEYDVFPDVSSIPNYPKPYIICDSPIIPVGREIYTGQGDVGLQLGSNVNTPGRYFYCFEVPRVCH